MDLYYPPERTGASTFCNKWKELFMTIVNGEWNENSYFTLRINQRHPVRDRKVQQSKIGNLESSIIKLSDEVITATVRH